MTNIKNKLVSDMLFLYSEETAIIHTNHGRNPNDPSKLNNAYPITFGDIETIGKYDNKHFKEELLVEDDSFKFIFFLELTFYHFLLDILMQILVAKSVYSNATIILDIAGAVPDFDKSLLKTESLKREDVRLLPLGQYKEKILNYIDLIEQLQKNNIKYILIDSHTQYLKANKIHVTQTFPVGMTYNSINLLSKNLIENNVLDKNIVKDKKIYLSRRHMKSLADESTNPDSRVRSIINYFFRDHNARIDNEIILENFLKDNFGFEIIIPEVEFTKGLTEQIEYFSKAKIIMSLTSSGLTNQLFADSNCTIIELLTPINSNKEEGYHCQYSQMSHYLKKRYISIPHNRSVNDIINAISSNKYIQKVLES